MWDIGLNLISYKRVDLISHNKTHPQSSSEGGGNVPHRGIPATFSGTVLVKVSRGLLAFFRCEGCRRDRSPF